MPDPLPERLLFAEPARRRMGVRRADVDEDCTIPCGRTDVLPLQGTRELEPGQSVTPHGADRGLDVDEIRSRR